MAPADVSDRWRPLPGGDRMTAIPGVRYARNDDLFLAYQVVGTGPRDLVYLQFETPTIVGHWLFPENARYLERLASFSRLILTDRRGMGCSTSLPPGESPTLEDLVEDLLAIMEDAYARGPVLMGGFESAFVAMMAAATHPDRFDGLILFGPAPSWGRSDDLPWERPDDVLQHELNVMRRATDLHAWAEQYARDLIPSRAGDPQMVSILQALSALSGTPETWYWDQRMFSEVDLLDLLPTIRIPTLVLSRPDVGYTGWSDPRSAQVVAERIPGARYVELPGRDSPPWYGESEPVLAEIREFVTGSRDTPPAERRLATILFTDIVGSTERSAELGGSAWKRVLEDHLTATRRSFARHGGREISTAGDGFLATFDGPAAAARCAVEIAKEAHGTGLPIRAGVHTGEVETIDGEIGGIGIAIGARVASLAGASEVLVTSTVKDLSAGSGLSFEDRGEHDLKGVPDRWHLYRVVG